MWCIVGCDRTSEARSPSSPVDDVGCVDTVRIFDCPTQTVMVNRRPRKRVCVDGMVALVRELDLPAGTVAHPEVGGGRSAAQRADMFRAGSSHRDVARRAGVPRLRCALGGRLHVEVGAEARASGSSHATKTKVATWRTGCSLMSHQVADASAAPEAPRSGGSPAPRRAWSLGRGNRDVLATRVNCQIALRKSQQQRVARAPIVID